jgi:hypothetical protein
MNTKHSKKEHLEAAASHHEQAGRFHREASRHFEAGKDFAHAAHQAMMAHGHALHAIYRANDAVKHNSSTPLIVPPPRAPPKAARPRPSITQWQRSHTSRRRCICAAPPGTSIKTVAQSLMRRNWRSPLRCARCPTATKRPGSMSRRRAIEVR